MLTIIVPTLSVVNNRTRSFTISGNPGVATASVVGSAGQGGPNTCSADWLLIGCSRIADKVPASMTCEDRICGTYFSAESGTTQRTVTSKWFYVLLYAIDETK